ncbi:MAG: type II secretion system GspH family protein [bacterium]|nr:type II secretion system GspH family protein [bacterium]
MAEFHHRSDARPSADAGFTLAEMLAALGILLVGVVSLLGALGAAVGERRTTDARLTAAKVCDLALHRVRHESVRRAADAGSDLDLEIIQLEDQTVPGFDGMTWSAEAVVDENRPMVWLVRLEVRWLEEGENASEEFLRILPRNLPLGQRVQRFREEQK